MFFQRRSKLKFSNERIKVGGLSFDSRLEQRMYSTLIMAPNVKDVELHKSFDLIVKNKKICAVEPDFTIKLKSGIILYADAKSDPTETEVSRLKFKLFHVLYGKKVWILPRELGAFLDLCEAKEGDIEFSEVGESDDDFNP